MSVLLLHHAAGSSSDWSEVVSFLGPGVPAVVPDLPGHGGRMLAEPLGSVEAMASHVAGLARDQVTSPLVAVGHSMGGAVALQLALDFPELVSGLVLLSTGARLRVASALLELVREHFPALPQQMVAMGFSPSAEPSVVHRWASAPWSVSPAAAVADFAACDRFDVRARLGEVGVPVVVMVGEHDMMTPVKRARELSDGISGAVLRVLPDTGHLLPWERPRDVAAAILGLMGTRKRGGR